METGQSRERQQQVRGAVPEPQNSRPHPGAREPLRNKESAPADGAGQTVEEERVQTETESRLKTKSRVDGFIPGDFIFSFNQK